MPACNRRTAGPRTAGRDQEWLRRVLLWAGKWRVNGRPVLDANPMHGFPIAREKNPRRPVASEDRYEATRAVSDDIMTKVRGIEVRSHLSEILDIINGRVTGHGLNLLFVKCNANRGYAAPGSQRTKGTVVKAGPIAKAGSARIKCQ